MVATETARGTDERFSYLAADDAARADDLMRAWCDPDVKAVFCGRGGYGAQRVVDLLDWQALAAAGPKVLVGFSDVTALHQAFATRLGLSTIHGPVVSSLGPAATRSRATHLRSLLFEPSGGDVAHPVGCPATGAGHRRGCARRWQPGAARRRGRHRLRVAGRRSRIAVLEDTGEPLYRIDRLLTQLLRSGWFDGVRGIALGDFTDGASAESVQDLAIGAAGPVRVPMLWPGCRSATRPATWRSPSGCPRRWTPTPARWCCSRLRCCDGLSLVDNARVRRHCRWSLLESNLCSIARGSPS